jgi:hypothetical protein
LGLSILRNFSTEMFRTQKESILGIFLNYEFVVKI